MTPIYFPKREKKKKEERKGKKNSGSWRDLQLEQHRWRDVFMKIKSIMEII